MINKKSIEAVEKSEVKGMRIPLYNSYCFSNIFGSIKEAFNMDTANKLPKDVMPKNIGKTNKVVFFLVDAFGWSFYERYKNESVFLNKVLEKGVISKITSQFPSTTTAHVTTAVTGMPVYEHGLYEWFYYEPKADNIITSFLYSGVRREGKENLKDEIGDPYTILPRKNYFQELKNGGVKSVVYHPSYINESIYTKTMCKGATIKGYDEYNELFYSLFNDLKKDEDKEYYYVYLPEIDSTAHEKGNTSEEFDAIMRKFLKELDNFYNLAHKEVINTLLMISADHGQIDIDLDKKNYLNTVIEDFEEFVVKNKNGELMCPAGYCRDMFLHIKEERLIEAKENIEKELGHIIDVYTFDELCQTGIFGTPSDRLRERCGNLVLIPKDKENIWWYEEGNFSLFLKGAHGGVSKEEMEIPLLVYKFD